jgi:selenoprotein W-related protein
LAAKLFDTFRQNIKNLNLIPGAGGVFDVEVNGKLWFSKKKEGRFPDEKALIDELKKNYPAAA